jgi:hypothetical protein
LVQRATVLKEERTPSKPLNERAVTQEPAWVRHERPETVDNRLSDVCHALRSFHLLLRAYRLYDDSHPQVLDSLDSAYDTLREVASEMAGLEARAERGGIVVAKIGESHLPDPRGEFQALATDLLRADIQVIYFSTKFHVGELDTLARLIKATLLRSEGSAKRLGKSWWPKQLQGKRVQGIQVNTLTERKVDSILASLVAALVAYGGNAPLENGDAPIRAPQSDELSDTLRLIGRLTPPMEVARGLSPEEAARAIHAPMENANRGTVRLLLSSMTHYSPQEGESPQGYLLRLSQILILEYMGSEFAVGALAPIQTRTVLNQFAEILVNSGEYQGPHASQHLSSLATAWAGDSFREQNIERFWQDLPAREKSAVMRGPEIWCVPITAIRQTLRLLVDTGADAPRREARTILLNYARRLEHTEGTARRSVAAGLGELTPLLESLWPNQLPEELSRGTLAALTKETMPETSALLASFLETLGRIAVTRGDFAGFENILIGLERVPRDAEHEHLTALGHRLVANDRWMMLVDAALANRALDAALPRLLQRDLSTLADRSARQRNGSGDGAFASLDWRAGFNGSRDAPIRSATSAGKRRDQTARGRRPGSLIARTHSRHGQLGVESARSGG